MKRRGDEEHVDLSQHARRVIPARGRIARRAHGEIGAPRGERVPGSAQHFMQEAQARARFLLVEFGHDSEQAIEPDPRVDRDAQLRFPTLGHLLHAALEVGCRLQQPAAFGQKLAAGVGEHCAMAAAVKDVDAKGVLDLLDGVSDR